MKRKKNSPHLRIAQIAPLWTRIPPQNYGGTELIVHVLTEELVKRGHDVTLFASGDSRTSARLKAVCESNLLDAMGRGEAYEYVYYANAGMVEALLEADSFDVIHCHLGCSMIPFSALSKTLIVHRIATALTLDDQWALRRYPDVPIVAISHDQVEPVVREGRENIRVIYNGCDLDAYDFSEAPGRYLAFLGRMGPHKSPLDAIRIAKEVGWPIVLAGKPQDGLEEAYFAEKIKPLIDDRDVTYIGPVNHAQKNEFLKNAAALLFPIQWSEPFGIVMIEAMACGTPVVACNKGSVGEVIDYGVTGFYADSAKGLPPLVEQALALDRKTVRARAEDRFSHVRMVDEYEGFYQSLVRGAGRH